MLGRSIQWGGRVSARVAPRQRGTLLVLSFCMAWHGIAWHLLAPLIRYDHFTTTIFIMALKTLFYMLDLLTLF